MLDVRFMLSDDCTPDEPVIVKESRGRVRFELCHGLFLPAGVAGLNSAVRQILAGGQWFQLWQGDIISMSTPEFKEFTDARIHRGPLVDEEAGPRHR